MRVTFVLPPPDMSGGIKIIVIYAKLLQSRGHQVVLVSPPPENYSLPQQFRLLLNGEGWRPNIKRKPSHLDGQQLDYRVLDRYRPIIDGDLPDADLVIATWWETAEWVNGLSEQKGVKVHFIQGHEVFDYLPVDRCRAVYRLPFHKITVSRWLQRIMRDEYGDNQADLVPNSVDHQQFFAEPRAKCDAPTVGFIFSPMRLKGGDLILAAVDRLRSDFPNLRVVTFGAYELPKAWRALPGIEFQRSPAQDEIRSFYTQCDVWISASRSEGFNLPAMEAMACRTPVVSTKTGWPEQAIVDGRNGYLVEIDDADGLFRAASKVLELEDREWREMSANAYETVAESSWQASVELFEQALENARRRAGVGELSGGVGAESGDT